MLSYATVIFVNVKLTLLRNFGMDSIISYTTMQMTSRHPISAHQGSSNLSKTREDL